MGAPGKICPAQMATTATLTTSGPTIRSLVRAAETAPSRSGASISQKPASTATTSGQTGARLGCPRRGAGSDWVAGPYGGGPFSLVIAIRALAGPFDLGTVVVRAAIKVDPTVVGPLVFATLVFLSVHFLYHRNVWKSILFGVIVALVAHWMDKRL